MNAVIRSFWVSFTLLLLAASPLRAQEGIGAILDWINKLSGPRFGGVGATFYAPLYGEGGEERSYDTSIRYRLSVAMHFSYDSDDAVDPDGASIRMLTIRNSVEFPVRHIPLDFAVGFSLHRFSGDPDTFWHWSVPLRAQYRVRLSPTASLRFGPTVDVFPKFAADDFQPLTVDVSRDRTEAVFGFLVGVDFQVF
ncbi:MAG TPA: hypothetical protein VE173_11155 [Longimicrobiales bacterium]|jgi:hypothetical protein|nr:hypothetical protein [Longimicrobiales bacterium]